ncbi:MAG: hypothetical protein HAW67_05300 [Endozoicomonadaceae bacterium]|nr:hypothetical protein [Endozoicomonadaceae bacterium]
MNTKEREQFIKGYAATLIKHKPYGVSSVQHHTRLNYQDSLRLIAYGVNAGYLVLDLDTCYLHRVNPKYKESPPANQKLNSKKV